ncbi:CHASE3 domain-containing protein, partial [Rugamonas sp.]|uniref:methyl-accepting chemotaxis protein n=1 Tax=Rugamonas sp. TaxID=1926287 RepID=UPI0025CDB954
MIKDLRIKNKLATGFGLIVAIILLLLALAYINFGKLSNANRWDRHTLEVLLEVDHIENALLQIQTANRGFMLTGDESIAAPMPQQEAAAYLHLDQVAHLTIDNASQQQRLATLRPLVDEWINRVIHPLVEKRRLLNQTVGMSMQAATVADIVNGSKTMAEIRRQIADIGSEENRLLAIRSTELRELRRMMMLVLTAGGITCVVLAALIGYLLSRALLLPLNQLTDTAGKIAAGRHDARVDVLSRDELGQVAIEFNRMAQAMQDNLAQELAATGALKLKVDALLAVVSKAASGDLTGHVSITGGDAIGQLGAGLARMFDNLRSLVSDVQKAGIQVTTAATEIAASARQQEATGIEQAQTSVEILSTTREISANTTQLLKAMEDATAVADYTTSATAEAQSNLQRMDGTMRHMVSATDSINAKLAALSEKASNINSVLVTITKVADQTNILSLNAAI